MPAMGLRLFVSRRPWLQSIRSLTQLVTFTLIWVSLFWTPITTVTMVLFTGPLILVALSVPFLGERVGPRRWAAVFVGFAGVLIVLRPGADAVHWGALLVLGGAFFYAIYQIQTRKLAGYDDPRTTAVYTILAAFIVATVAVPFFWEMPRNTVDWLLFLALGVVGGARPLFHHQGVPIRRGVARRPLRLQPARRREHLRLPALRRGPGYVDLGRRRRDHRKRSLHRPPGSTAQTDGSLTLRAPRSGTARAIP